MRQIIDAIGEDPEREGLAETPRRIAAMYADLFSGLERDPLEVLRSGFREENDGPVILRDIPFYSLCEHHFLPFYGVAHVGYIPDGRLVGISKIARALDILARRPQVQERLTRQLADCILEALNADGVGVVLEAEHFCLSMRGAHKPGARVVTSAVRGPIDKGTFARSEFLALVQGRG
ncbi:MAG: GTP cyclohydrolase I FolE [Dehalococcoidia bacterium]|nr:GTP cyclohydrolase I FolE [Dehalococcoidia bacterium]